MAQSDATPTLTSVVSESFPHLRRGAIRDFLSIMQGHGYFRDGRWNRTDCCYEFETGSKVEFFSVDQPGKVRGPRRDRLFINEANNVSFEAFDQLEVRTREFVFLDYNPTSEFWYLSDVLGKRDDVEHVTLTYLDNESLDPKIRDSIERRKGRKGWWTVYGLGRLGEVEGRIYKDWEIVDSVPHAARLERRGLDFGYTNDPTAIVDVYYLDGGYVLDEAAYSPGLSNRKIADILLARDPVLTVADGAEPKSIDEIMGYGVSVIAAQKGPGSVLQGIQFVQDKRVSVTRRSVNLIREYRNYLWATDAEGRLTNAPEGGMDHCLDAVRYAFFGLRERQEVESRARRDEFDPYSII